VPSKAATTTTFRLSGEQTLRTIAETHRALTQALARSANVTIDARDVTEADLTIVQLIESARRWCAREGKKVCMTSPPPEALREILIRGGFLNAPDNALFWTAP
jgi:ABC-type transporter Mla MlaB component